MEKALRHWEPSNQKILDINYSQIGTLPIMVGALKSKNGEFKVINILPDSGASLSVASAQLLELMGLSLKDLDPVPGYQIKTANGLSDCCGKIRVQLFLNHASKVIYYIHCDILILPADSCTLDKILLSYHDLIQLKAEWKFNGTCPSISLDCYWSEYYFHQTTLSKPQE